MMARRQYSERHREQRKKNLAVLFALLAFCIIFYFVFVTRAGLFG